MNRPHGREGFSGPSLFDPSSGHVPELFDCGAQCVQQMPDHEIWLPTQVWKMVELRRSACIPVVLAEPRLIVATPVNGVSRKLFRKAQAPRCTNH